MTPNEAYCGRKVRLPIDANVDLLDVNDRGSMERNAVMVYNDWIKTMRNMSIKAASLELEKYDRARKEYYERIHKPPHWRRGMKVFHWAGPNHRNAPDQHLNHYFLVHTKKQSVLKETIRTKENNLGF